MQASILTTAIAVGLWPFSTAAQSQGLRDIERLA